MLLFWYITTSLDVMTTWDVQWCSGQKLDVIGSLKVQLIKPYWQTYISNYCLHPPSLDLCQPECLFRQCQRLTLMRWQILPSLYLWQMNAEQDFFALYSFIWFWSSGRLSRWITRVNRMLVVNLHTVPFKSIWKLHDFLHFPGWQVAWATTGYLFLMVMC